MAVYTNLPTLNIDFIKPGNMSFDTPGGGLGSPRNSNGQSISIEMSGGGVVTGKYENCFVQSPEQHEYINWLSARLNGSHRFINVPILTDWTGPFQKVNGAPHAFFQNIPHSDESLFVDDAGYSQTSVYGEITPAALNAGIIEIRLIGASRPLRYSDWFSVMHPTKGWRMYRYWDVISITQEDEPVYTLAISPPLREAITTVTRVEFARPLCVMKFPFDFTLAWEIQGFYRSSPALQFEEAF